jgi:hypothetical protein
MRRGGAFDGLTLLSAGVLLMSLVPGRTSAQVSAVESPTPAVGAGDGLTVGLAVALGIGLVLAIVAVAKLYDLKRGRDAEAVHIQSRLADVVLRDPLLSGTSLTPTARVPFWTGSPVVVVVSGEVSSPELRDVALRIVQADASRMRPDVQIEDRVMVLPTIRRAA